MELQDRPVYIAFELRAVESREKSEEAGHPVYDDVPYVKVTPPGGNLIVDKVAEEWLASKKKANDPYYRHYKETFEAWQEDREAPIEGTAIEMWPSATPAQVKQVRQAGIRTVEDLGAANEPVIQKLGMGGRALKDRAAAWLESAKDTGKVAEQLASALATIETQNQQIAELAAKVDALTEDKPKRGRKAA